MMTDEFPHMRSRSPTTVGGTSTTIYLYVDDDDKIYVRAIKQGATPTIPIMDAFWGDRCGSIIGPFGHSWMIATHKKNVTPDEMQKAAKEFMSKQHD